MLTKFARNYNHDHRSCMKTLMLKKQV